MQLRCDQTWEECGVFDAGYMFEQKCFGRGEAVVQDQESRVKDWAYSSYPQRLW